MKREEAKHNSIKDIQLTLSSGKTFNSFDFRHKNNFTKLVLEKRIGLKFLAEVIFLKSL